MSYKTERGNVAKKCLRFHAAVKMVLDYQSVTKYAMATSRQLAPEVIMGMFMSPLDAPGLLCHMVFTDGLFHVM